MSDRLPMSGNLPAEIAERLSDVPEAANDEPNFADVEDLQGVVRKELHEPLAQLYSTRDQIRVLQRSEAFGNCVNTALALEWLMKDLDALEYELRRLWADS
jgi:hypothetical protein